MHKEFLGGSEKQRATQGLGSLRYWKRPCPKRPLRGHWIGEFIDHSFSMGDEGLTLAKHYAGFAFKKISP